MAQFKHFVGIDVGKFELVVSIDNHLKFNIGDQRMLGCLLPVFLVPGLCYYFRSFGSPRQGIRHFDDFVC